MLCPPGMGGKVGAEGEPWTFSEAELWRAAPALARQARRCRLAPFGGSPARRCLSEPLDSSQLSQFVKEEHAACRAADRRRYNFDFETMEPLEGRFCWQRVSPPPADLGSGDDLGSGSDGDRSSPEGERPAVLGAALGPAAALVRPAPELARRRSEGAAGLADRLPGPAAEHVWTPAAGWTAVASSDGVAQHAVSTDILRSGKRPSAFSRCDGRRTKLAALSTAEAATETEQEQSPDA